MRRQFVAASVCATVTAVLAIHSHQASAQAWVSEKGMLGAGITYQADFAKTLVEKAGDETFEFGDSDTLVQLVMLDASYTPIENLGLRLLFPMIFSRYSGSSSAGSLFLPHGRWDDQKTHFTLQDLRMDARYQVLDGPIALSPLIGASVPMADYPIQGYAAPGRHVKKVHMGLSAGRTLDPILPRLYFHASYEFSLAEKVDDQPDLEAFSQNSSLIDITTGYFITDKLGAQLGLTYFFYHGGIQLVDYYDYSGDVRDYHDAVLKEQLLLLGATINYAIAERLSASLTGRTFLSGNNTRKTNQIGLSLTWEAAVAD